MPKPLTQSAIVNSALSRLGSTERISSIDDAKEVAKHAAAHWDAVLRHLTGKHPFNFALEREQLPALSAVPAHGWARQFKLPNDCLRFLPPRPGDDVHYECEVEGGKILTDAEAPLNVRFISSAKVDDTSRWPPYFAEAVELELAARMCEAVTGASGLAKSLAEQAALSLKDAKRRDGLESGKAKRQSVHCRSRWLAASTGYRNWYDDPANRMD